MKNILEPKYIDFAKNKVDYKYLIADVAGESDKITWNGYYDWTPHQYERPRRIGIWYAELKYGSTLEDDFYKKIIKVVTDAANSRTPKDTLSSGLRNLVNSTVMGDKENGHLFRYAWYFYEGKPFSDRQDIKGNNTDVNDSTCLKQLGEIIIPFVKNWEINRIEVNKFEELISSIGTKIRKNLEKEKKKKIEASAIPLDGIKILISESTLDQDIKDEIFENIDDEYQDLKSIVLDGIIVHEDTLFGCIAGNENNWCLHFRDNLKRFPYRILTEHYTILYNGVKLTKEEKDEIKLKIKAKKYNL